MTHTLLVAGTASHVGKTTVVAGLCRLFASLDTPVAPYKAQNMSNNARVVPTPSGETGEIGVSQYIQARAGDVHPTTDVNPVLLKPRGDGDSQVVINGQAVGHYEAREYYAEHWDRARSMARASWERLAEEYEYVIAEGAGSIAEINLHHRDLANVETARFADADILLVGDIERGGVFGSLLGTLSLLPDDLRARVVGCLITKFRGDRSLLTPGIEAFERRTGVPVLGVLPYDDPGLPEEDSVALPPETERATIGGDDGVPETESVTIAVPRLPRISNFTDLTPLERTPGVRVMYLPLSAGKQLTDADAVVVPGTKNTVDDCLALRSNGFDASLRAFDGPIVGICGGYQLLGERLTNAAVEATGSVDVVEGVGVLPTETRFSTEKHVEPVSRTIHGCGPLDGATGTVTGYEIHMGETKLLSPVDQPFDGTGAATDRVLGTYVHGLFENRPVREAFLDSVFAHAGLVRPEADESARRVDLEAAYDRAADLIREHVDLEPLGLPT
ncbi:cobyric acid synthase [Halocatena salina]|uniref:Probable cobyric acid synthase n=1 Tax=Halocatena salina TaxID=2934340 RepID=A0A8U0A084_9EURY|nr:cobyric acid synthase [Halocatena salina]UPM41818.1 cobyric acid synthase [Halocatena salina]